MSMCSDGAAIPTCDLMAYVDGEAMPAVSARIAGDPYWSAVARTYSELQQALRRHLHRFDCPAPLALGEYDLGLFGQRDQPGIAWHAGVCPHCASELRMWHAFLDEPIFAPIRALIRARRGALFGHRK